MPSSIENLPAPALAAELARREAQAQAEQTERDAVRKAEQAERAKPILAGWKATEEELIASERQAYEDFKSAVLDDAMIGAYVRYRWHRYRRAAVRTEAQSAANVLGDFQAAERIVNLREWGSQPHRGRNRRRRRRSPTPRRRGLRGRHATTTARHRGKLTCPPTHSTPGGDTNGA